MLHGADPSKTQIDALNLYLILLADHGFNASTFSARVTAGTLANLHSAITSAVGTLSGPLHGGANEKAMDMIIEVGTKKKLLITSKMHLIQSKKSWVLVTEYTKLMTHENLI